MRLAVDDIASVEAVNRKGCPMCGGPRSFLSVEATYDAIDGPVKISLCLVCAVIAISSTLRTVESDLLEDR
jgi:hypothetical protein